jgi:hypothetical protein
MGLLCFLQPVISQNDSSFQKVPFKDDAIVYEKVFYLDSVNDQTKVFNAVKSTLIKNTNYKASKIDEDRTSGSISTQISFLFSAKPGIARLTFTGTTLISIDVKANRFRVRLYNNKSTMTIMGTLLTYDMAGTYIQESASIEKGKWKEQKSIIIPWDEKLRLILNGFPILIGKGLNEEDF